MEAYSVASWGKWVKIGLILVCFIIFIPQNYWNHQVTQIGQYEDLMFEKVDYIYDEDSWIINLELRSKGNIPVHIHEVYYTLYERQTPDKYETCSDRHSVMLLKDTLSNPIMVPSNEKIIVEGVCQIIGYIYSDAEVRTSEINVDRYLVLSRDVNPGEIMVNNLTCIDHNGVINHWKYLENGPITIPPSMKCIIEFRVSDVESRDTVKIVLNSAGMHYTENIQLPITQ